MSRHGTGSKGFRAKPSLACQTQEEDGSVPPLSLPGDLMLPSTGTVRMSTSDLPTQAKVSLAHRIILGVIHEMHSVVNAWWRYFWLYNIGRIKLCYIHQLTEIIFKKARLTLKN